MNTNIIDIPFREVVYNESLREAYLNDSEDVLLLTLLLDLSNSVYQAGAFSTYNALLPTMKDIICLNDEAKAKVKIAVIRYGTDVEEVSGFVPIYNLNTEDICYDMGTTDTAAALKYAFEITRKEMERNTLMGKRVLRSIVFHVTDGLPTSDKDSLEEAIANYDKYKSHNGKRRVQLFAATPSESVAKRLVYSDNTYLTEDYKGIGDAIATIAEIASVLSSLPVSENPETGEVLFDTSEADGITRRNGIRNLIPHNPNWTINELMPGL